MKNHKIICALLLLLVAGPAIAQHRYGYRRVREPQRTYNQWNGTLDSKWSLLFGTGLGFGANVDNRETSYFDYHSNPVSSSWRAEIRQRYLGFEYLYSYSAADDDKMSTHYIGPTLTLSTMLDGGRKSLYLQFTAGLLNYSQTIEDDLEYRRSTSRDYDLDYTFDEEYFALGISLGYQQHISNNLGFDAKLEILTADWFVNDDYQMFPETQDENENMFKNNLTFINLTVALRMGW